MLTICTYDWVPGGQNSPRGFVRDLRLRWACEEAGLDYQVRSMPFHDRGPAHLAQQPFGQIPFIQDDDITVFESGACLIYLGRKSELLLPRDLKGEFEAVEWTIAALNSIEMVSVPWWFTGGATTDDKRLTGWLTMRLKQLDDVLQQRQWLAAGRFTIADILMADVLRQTKLTTVPGNYPALVDYVGRLTARPAFAKAHADQLAHFAKADATQPPR